MANQKGTSSHDTLRGTINNDLIEGLGGNDHLYGLDGNDILRGGDGYDVLFGENGNDTLEGGALDDWFYGSVGNDLLTGGSGADRFVFETGLSASSNVDTITDFATGSDKIWLNTSIFSKLTVNGALDASILRIGSAAADSNDHIIYNKDTGALIYDSNGSAAGGAVQFATIGKGLNLTGNDFNVFGAPASAPITPMATASAPAPANAPTPTGVVTKVGSGSDTLTLKIAQNAYQGDAQYAVYVDGKQIGGTFTAKALHDSSQYDTLEIKGDWGVGNHTVGVKLLNDLWGGSYTADRNVYVESATYNGAAVTGSYQFINGSQMKSFTVADKTAVPSPSTTPTIPTTPAPTGVVTKVGTGSDTLTLKITQDAYQGDSQYAVYVDGKQVGGTFTAKALHGGSQYDTLEIKGDWGVGNHTVGVKLLNDLYGGSATTDRNVYVESATYNGSAVTGSYQYVNAADTKSFTVTDSTVIPSTTTPAPVTTPTTPTGQNLTVGTGSDTLTLKFTQDAWQGDSKFVVLVDGKQIGGEFTGKSLHNSGVMDTLTIKGDWGVGAHSVQFKMTNDGWGGTAATDRNIHVESATYNGVAVSNSYQFVNTSDLKGFSVNDTTAVPGTAPTTPTNPAPDPVGGIKLTKTTTQIKSSFAGQVIENKDIWVDAGDAVSIIHDNVILKNCRIHHKGGDGVNISNAKNVQILNCEIINSDPPTGQNGETSSTLMNIEAFRASGLKIDNVTLRDGSSGIYVQESPGTIITNIEGYNFHGPFPRGQLVQFNQSDNSKLSGFYNYNDLKNSRTEDNVNVYHSNNVVIENGKIDGNNSPTGVGVLFEGDSSGGIVRNVDVVRMSNGAFSSYSNDVDFFDVRTFDGYNTDIGLGKSTSNGLSFNHSASGVTFDDATWTRPANSNNISWGSQSAEFLDIKQDAGAVVMSHSQWVNIWNWIL